MGTKKCTRCHIIKQLDQFYWVSGKRKRYESRCKACHGQVKSQQLAKRESRNISLLCARKDKANSWARRWRKNPANRARVICIDSRSSDRKFGRAYALNPELVQALISQPCAYCGSTDLMMTLDRKDNAIGHVPTNVVPCCVRCNYVRRDMPYAAWCVVYPSMRKARETGAFGGWTCGVHSRGRVAQQVDAAGLNPAS